MLSPLIHNSVNVITGEYTEAQTDLTLNGPYHLHIGRCYEDQEWNFNLPNLLPGSVLPLTSEGTYQNKKIIYEYDKEARLKSVKATNVKGDKTYNQVNLHYQNSVNRQVRAETQDGQALIYQFKDFTAGRASNSCLLEKVIAEEGYECLYQYCDHPSLRKKIISRREEPQGRFLITEYYESGENDVGGAIVQINSLRDFRLGRVKLQKAPVGSDSSPVIVSRFFYYDGYTEVYNALGQKTVYRYGNQNRLSAIEHYLKEKDGSHTLYRVQRCFWDEKERHHICRLLSRTLEDGAGNTLACRSYDYDNRGLVISETLYGNLTGGNAAPILILEGRPIKNGVEGYSQNFKYSNDEIPLLLEEVQSNGKTTRYIYDNQSQKLTAKLICDRDLIRIRHFYEYDADGFLIKMILDDGCSENQSDLLGVTQRHITAYTLRQEEPGIGMPEAIDEMYVDMASMEAKLIKRIVNHYSEKRQIIQQDIFDAEGLYHSSTYNEFDKRGRLINSIDSQGKGLSLSYDTLGNKISESIFAKGILSSKILHHYDFAGRLIETQETGFDGHINISRHRYDFCGNKISDMDSFGNETQYEFDSFGRCTLIIQPAVLDGFEQRIHPIKKNDYDIFDHIIALTDPNGHTTQSVYNVYGKPVEILFPDGTAERMEYALDGSLYKRIERNGTYSIYQHDFLGRPVKVEFFDSEGKSMACKCAEYTAFHLVSYTEGNGVDVRISYDGAGRQIAKESIGDGAARKTLLAYDSLGQLETTREWYGTGAFDYGDFITSRDESDIINKMLLKDFRGQILKETITPEKLEVKDSSLNKNYSYYNERGQNVLQIIAPDKAGNVTVSTMDALGRTESVIRKNPLGQTISQLEYRYDLSGNKVKETYSSIEGREPEKKQTTFWTYGPNNRIEACIEGLGSPHQAVTSYTYDRCGRLENMTKPDGVAISYRYGPSGFISEMKSSDGSVHYRYEHDSVGNILAVDDFVNGGLTCRCYNSFNQIVSEVLGNGLHFNSSYDLLGRRLQFTIPDGSAFNYEYNASYMTRVQRFSASGKEIYSHTYEGYNLAGGLLSAMLIGNLGAITYRRDGFQRCLGIASPHWSESISEGFDALGNIKHTMIVDAGGICDSFYEYNEKGELVSETGAVENNFIYDPVSNRLSKNGGQCVNDIMNRLITCGNKTYKYDLNGNLVSIIGDSICYSYEYDALNRLTGVVKDKESAVHFTYDAFNRRLTKESSVWDRQKCTWKLNKAYRYLYDGDHEIGAMDHEGNIVELRVLGVGIGADIGAAVAIELEGRAYAPIHDHRGNVSCLVDLETQKVAEFTRYSAFGEAQYYNSDQTDGMFLFKKSVAVCKQAP